VLTGGRNFAVPKMLESILAACKQLPIKEFYLINCSNNLTEVPEACCELKTLEYLALYNNQISSLPEGISKLMQLKKLHIDKNPIEQLPNSIFKLTSLHELGIVETLMSDETIKMMQEKLPNCSIIKQIGNTK
jgi:hypothetical protein